MDEPEKYRQWQHVHGYGREAPARQWQRPKKYRMKSNRKKLNKCGE